MAGCVGLLPNLGSPSRAGDHGTQALLGAHLGHSLPQTPGPWPQEGNLAPPL